MRKTLSTIWRSVRRWLPGVIISVVALVIVFRLIRWQDLGQAFGNFRPLNIALAILLTIASLYTRAMAWRTLLDYKPSVGQTFLVINEGYLLNNVFPLRAGEIGRAVFMGQSSKLGPLHVLSTIVIERTFDLAMAAGMVLATLPLALGAEWARPFAIFTLALVIAMLAAMYLAAKYNGQVQSLVLRIGKKWGFVQRWVVPRLASLLNGFAVLTRPSQFFISLGWIVASWALWVLVHYVMIITILAHVPIWYPVFVDGVLAVGAAVPSAPSALGVFEASVVGSLKILGVNASIGLAYAIVMHFISFAVTGVFGLFGLLKEGRSLTGITGRIGKQTSVENPLESADDR